MTKRSEGWGDRPITVGAIFVGLFLVVAFVALLFLTQSFSSTITLIAVALGVYIVIYATIKIVYRVSD
jgi:uncharacterized membrane protein